VLGKDSNTIVNIDGHYDFPALLDETRVIKKLPYFNMKHTDKKGSPERPHYVWDGGTDYWTALSKIKNEDNYSYNCSEPCFVEDD
jgi:hypothetical protein